MKVVPFLVSLFLISIVTSKNLYASACAEGCSMQSDGFSTYCECAKEKTVKPKSADSKPSEPVKKESLTR